MSRNIINNEKNLENESPTLSKSVPKSNTSLKSKNDLEKFIPFTKKWRVKLYILNEVGQWDDKGIGYVFCANEPEEEKILSGGKQNSCQLIKKLIMLEEKTNEIVFNIDIRKENSEFHNQRGTIITWKKPGTLGEDNTAISFQEKEGVIEILKNIKIINGKNISEEDLLKDDPSDIYLDVSIENLPNLVRELGVNMEELKLSDFIAYLSETNCEFVKKLGKLLNEEEKRVEELKSSASFSSSETDISLIVPKDIKNENIKDGAEKNIVASPNKKTNRNNKINCNENINYIFTIFKNLILIADKDLLELLFNDECYLITFGALEHDSQSNKTVPHRKYFKEIVKFKNPLNIKDQVLLQKINQNLRLTYLRDTAFGRLIEDNTNRCINNIIQMNNNEIIQFFINNKEYLEILFSQLESEDILIKKDAILFLSELISCSKIVVQSRVTFNEVLCKNGILPILSKLIQDNPKEVNKNDKNKEIKELININAVEIFINILSNVPFLIRQYLVENEGQMLLQLTNLLLYHDNFGVKYEVSQIFKALIEGTGESYDKKLFFNSSIDSFISYLLSSNSAQSEKKNEISSTIQIILEIFMAWINNMGFDYNFWLEKYQIDSVIIKLLKEKNKIINLYTIKLLKTILEDCEHYICIEILSNELCNLIFNLFKENMKKNNLITSCLLNFFDSISQNDIYILSILMRYSSDFFYNNKEYFSNVIKRYERKSLPKKKLLGFLNINTITETSLRNIEPIYHSELDNYKQNEDDNNFNYLSEDNNLNNGNEDDDSYAINKNNDLFMVENSSENRILYLNRKRNLDKTAFDEEEVLDYDIEPLNKRLNNLNANYYKNINIYNNDKYKNKDYIYMNLKEVEDEMYGDLDDKDLF